MVLVDAGREWREEKDAVSVVCLDGWRERGMEGWRFTNTHTHTYTYKHTPHPFHTDT